MDKGRAASNEIRTWFINQWRRARPRRSNIETGFAHIIDGKNAL